MLLPAVPYSVIPRQIVLQEGDKLFKQVINIGSLSFNSTNRGSGRGHPLLVAQRNKLGGLTVLPQPRLLMQHSEKVTRQLLLNVPSVLSAIRVLIDMFQSIAFMQGSRVFLERKPWQLTANVRLMTAKYSIRYDA